jgi:hypothetical protein
MAESEKEPNYYHHDSENEPSDTSDSSVSKSLSPSELGDQENSAPDYIPGSGDDDLNFTDNSDEKPSKSTKNKGFFKSKFKSRLLLGGVAAGGGMVVIILLLLLLAGILKVPGIEAYIIEKNFTRSIRQSASTDDRVSEEELAIETTADDGPLSLRAQLQDQYQNLRDSTWGKLDKYRPKIVIQNLEQNSSGLKINTTTTKFGNTLLDTVELEGKTYTMTPLTKLQSFTPVFRQFSEFKNNINFARNFAPALEESLGAAPNEVGPIVRSLVASKIRQQLGIGLIAWTLGKFAGKSPPDAQVVLDQQATTDVSNSGPKIEITEPVEEARTSEVNAATQGNLDALSPPIVKQTEKAGGVDVYVNAAINNPLEDNLFKDAVGLVNPLYAVAVPVCIIYDGSLDSSGSTINNQTQSQEKAFYYLADAGDEQKAGGPADPTGTAESLAVGAMNAKLGDTSQSNPYIWVNGGSVDTSTTSLSAESSPNGDYTLLNTTFPKPLADFINAIAVPSCSVLTNVWTGAAVGIASIIASFFGGGPAEAELETTAKAVQPEITAAITRASDSLLSRVVDAILPKAISSAPGTFAKLRALLGITKDTAKSVAEVTGATLLAKLIVMDRAAAGGFYNGMEQGSDFANEADSGANIQAGEIERQQLFGRPLTCAEVAQSNQADQQYIAYQDQSLSPTDRYLALSNPNSLLSHMATAVYADTNGSLLNPVTSLVSNVISGPFSISSIFGSLTGIAHASPSCANENYGNVQFGWSQAEENLIDSSNSYAPLENEAILEAPKDLSGHPLENDVAKQYAYCFGYDYNSNGDGSLDPTDPSGNLVSDITGTGPYVNHDGSIGGLLANGDIVRDSTGDIAANSGNCSPDNLGINNTAINSPCGLGGCGDLVFRWRLAMSYDTSINKLTSMQSVTN